MRTTKSFNPIARILALFLSLLLVLPNPAFALRVMNPIDAGLEEKLAQKLGSPATNPSTVGLEETAKIHLGEMETARFLALREKMKSSSYHLDPLDAAEIRQRMGNWIWRDTEWLKTDSVRIHTTSSPDSDRLFVDVTFIQSDFVDLNMVSLYFGEVKDFHKREKPWVSLRIDNLQEIARKTGVGESTVYRTEGRFRAMTVEGYLHVQMQVQSLQELAEQFPVLLATAAFLLKVSPDAGLEEAPVRNARRIEDFNLRFRKELGEFYDLTRSDEFPQSLKAILHNLDCARGLFQTRQRDKLSQVHKFLKLTSGSLSDFLQEVKMTPLARAADDRQRQRRQEIIGILGRYLEELKGMVEEFKPIRLYNPAGLVGASSTGSGTGLEEEELNIKHLLVLVPEKSLQPQVETAIQTWKRRTNAGQSVSLTDKVTITFVNTMGQAQGALRFFADQTPIDAILAIAHDSPHLAEMETFLQKNRRIPAALIASSGIPVETFAPVARSLRQDPLVGSQQLNLANQTELDALSDAFIRKLDKFLSLDQPFVPDQSLTVEQAFHQIRGVSEVQTVYFGRPVNEQYDVSDLQKVDFLLRLLHQVAEGHDDVRFFRRGGEATVLPAAGLEEEWGEGVWNRIYSMARYDYPSRYLLESFLRTPSKPSTEVLEDRWQQIEKAIPAFEPDVRNAAVVFRKKGIWFWRLFGTLLYDRVGREGVLVVGYPGLGKSTIASLLTASDHWEFLADDAILGFFDSRRLIAGFDPTGDSIGIIPSRLLAGVRKSPVSRFVPVNRIVWLTNSQASSEDAGRRIAKTLRIGRMNGRMNGLMDLPQELVDAVSSVPRINILVPDDVLDRNTPEAERLVWYKETALPQIFAGLEEPRVALTVAREVLEGYRSAIEVRKVVVIGESLAGRFGGLRVLSGLEEDVIVDQGDPADTAIRLAERGMTHVHYFGGLEETRRFKAVANSLGIEVSPHNLQNPTSLFLLHEILFGIGVPEGFITTGLEELNRNLEELGKAA